MIHDWAGKGIHLEWCKKLKFDHRKKWYMHNPESALENEIHKLFRDFQIQMDHLLLGRRPNLVIVTKKKENCRIVGVGFVVIANDRVKLKEGEKRDKYLNLARKLKKLWNMKVTVIPVVVGALGTICKGLVKGLEHLEIKGPVETIQITLISQTRILRRVSEICCHSKKLPKE